MMNTEMSVNDMAMMFLMSEMMKDSSLPGDANRQMPFSPMRSGQGSWMTDASDMLDGGMQGVPDPERFTQEIETLSTIFGPEAVEAVTQQLFTEKLADGFADMVGDLGMPSFAQDIARQSLQDNSRGGAGVNSDSDVGQAIESVLGDDIDLVVDMLMENVRGGMAGDSEEGADVHSCSGAAQASGGDTESAVDMVVDMVLENMRDEMADETKRAFSTSGTDGGQGGGRGAQSAQGGTQGGNSAGTSQRGDAGGGHAEHGTSGDHGNHETSGDHGNHEASGDHGNHEASGDHAAHETSDGGAAEGAEMSGGSDVNTDGGGGGDGSGGNWLVALASVMGKETGKHLKNMVDKADQLGGMDSEKNPEEYAEVNAELQASAQMFKLTSEALNTSLKSIGEGLSSIARKS